MTDLLIEPLDREHYEEAAIETALALAHMNWIALHSDAAANITALDPSALNAFEDWEQTSIPMKHAAMAASYWVARRTMAILINEFVFDLPAAANLLAVHCHDVPHCLRTALQQPSDTRDYATAIAVLIGSIAERMPHGDVETSNFQPPQMMQ